MDAGPIGIHHVERGAGVTVVLIADADTAGREDDPAVRQVGRADIVIGAPSELLESRSVQIDAVDVPPGIILATPREDDVPAVPGEFGFGHIAVFEVSQGGDDTIGLGRSQDAEVAPGSIGRTGVGDDVGLSPAVGLLDRADGVWDVVVALDEENGVEGGARRWRRSSRSCGGSSSRSRNRVTAKAQCIAGHLADALERVIAGGALQREPGRLAAEFRQRLRSGMSHLHDRRFIFENSNDESCMLAGVELSQGADQAFAPARSRVGVFLILERAAVAVVRLGLRLRKQSGYRFDGSLVADPGEGLRCVESDPTLLVFQQCEQAW